jgi:glucose-6-phosphate isomerase
MSMKYTNTASSASWALKCTDLAQFDALQAAADSFRRDDKLHLKNLASDTSRCAGLTATHTVHNIHNNTNRSKEKQSQQQQRDDMINPLLIGSTLRQRKMILDYSRQRVTGETMELLFDLADAVGLTGRREAMRLGEPINATGTEL